MARDIDAKVHYPPTLDQWINQCRPLNAVRPLTPQKPDLVRCDKSVPSCRRCNRLGVACPGYEPDHGSMSRSDMLKSTDDIFKAAGVDKRRIGSCNECRTSKSRCTRTRPTCQRCRMRGLGCVYRGLGADKDSSVSPSDLTSHKGPDEMSGVNAGLYSEVIPEDPALLSRLINTYFDRFHHLRCLAFIHKPSFMHSMARASVIQDYSESLLYAMCALSARCIYLDSLHASSEPNHEPGPIPGDVWAEKARKMVFDEIHLPTIHQIMTMILLFFMLCGCVFRAMRLLGLDSPPQHLQAAAQLSGNLEQEINHRIVWACYTIDVLLSSGVDKNSSWREDIPQVPLPCSDKDFLLQTPSRKRFLSGIEQEDMSTFVKDLDLLPLVTVLVRLRGKVLRIIRTLPPTDANIWDSSSPFMLLIRELDTFYESLPDRLQITELNTYIHKDQHTIGALFYLHLMYNAAIFDLTRISLAGFSFPLAASFQHAPPEFRSQCQERCRFHAAAVSDIVRQGLTHGRVAFDDNFCADVALESSKVQIIHSATVANDDQSTEKTRQNLRTTLQLFDLLHANQDGQSTYVRTLLPLCILFGFRDIAEEWRDSQTPHRMSPEVTGTAEVHHLVSFAPFRRAQTEIKARQSASPRTLSSSAISASQSARRANEERPPINSVDNAGPDQHLVAVPNPGPIAHNQAMQVMAQEMDTDQIDMTDLHMVHPSMEDYIRTAGEMSDYLTWNMSELPDLSIWTDFGGQDPSSG
ncbi:uncharacterized protein NECHADRAFT_76532 [Fusarium vanettenii 77-13-4]|uniref:Zn(2)-C6 fungal-type domain-containing protein n=1 Tax=Fusarium vanettenii (strain ATCC MYA-4622 / CBS 123669 / FGSC 9596 / NRRL 45880 / 77-13-4) TaxID=660122 RepID=C7Z4I3_FUSV7|nr:uncharacterized protein NECHADRAFT_76532 [Fusarium vanettenii 77-13-4]EEU40352.1 predicted protein [Fusarium vanettenii 77-13-4]